MGGTEKGSCSCEWWLGPGGRVNNGWIKSDRVRSSRDRVKNGGSSQIESRFGIEDRVRGGLREIGLILV